jgi:hypothetical protein
MAEAGVALWAWSGLGAGPAERPGAPVGWVGEAGPSWDGTPGGCVRLASSGGLVAADGWLFAGCVAGRAVAEYRSPGAPVRPGPGASPALAAAAAFLRDRAAESAAAGLPWWPAWRQAAAALCETYEGCSFDLVWTDGAVLLAAVQTLVLALGPDGTLRPAAAPAGPAVLARGRAELARLGLYAAGRCLAVQPITGAA